MNQAKQEIIKHKLATALFNAKTAIAFLDVAEIYLNEITEAIGPQNTLSEPIAVAVLRYLNRVITKEMDEEEKAIADTVEEMLNEHAVTIRAKL